MHDRAPDCEGCRDGYEMMEEEAPCETCRPSLLSGNYDAAVVLGKVQNQVLIGGMGDIIGLNYEAVRFVMDLYDIQDKRGCFEKVVFAFNRILKASQK